MIGVGATNRRYVAAAAQHGDPVRDLQHLVELVADEHHGKAIGSQSPHDVEQEFRFRVGQDRRGFIENEELGAARQRLENLHPLLLARR